MDELVKIVITGPESTSKSDLCQALAQRFNTLWVPEYAREYLEKQGPRYDLPTLNSLARQHLAFQKKCFRKCTEKLIFLDTDLINYKIWSKVVFGEVSPWILKQIQKESSHLYLITAPDIPWQHDPLRENPHNRQHLFDLHLREVAGLFRPYRVVQGMGEKRVSNAVDAARQLLKQKFGQP